MLNISVLTTVNMTFVLCIIVVLADVCAHSVKSIADEWSPIIMDQLSPWKREGITKETVSRTMNHTGSHVIFQNINKTVYIYDPNMHCLCNKAHVPSLTYGFHIGRCRAMQSILEAVVTTTDIYDFEFVWSIDDLAFWNDNVNTIDIKNSDYYINNILPGFGALRCWQKNTLSMPFYGSHFAWNITDHHLPPATDTFFHKKIGKAIFRGGIDRGCSFSHDSKINYNIYTSFTTERRDCGRYKLSMMAKEYPTLIDYNGSHSTFMTLDTQADKYKYVLSVEGFAGWADRLSQLLSLQTMVVFNQDHPCDQWFEPLLKPYVHYVPIANDFSDLPAKIIWANRNPHMTEQILNASSHFANRYLTSEGIIAYMYTIIKQYTELLRYNITYRDGSYPIKTLNDDVLLKNICAKI